MPRAPHRGTRIGCAFIFVLTSLAGETVRAQDGVGVESPAETGTATETDTAGFTERIDALSARSDALSTELDEALGRVSALEEERARDDAAELAEAAESATVTAEPTLHPLANLVTRFEHREGFDGLGSPRALQNAGCFGGGGPTVTLADSDCIRYRARVGFEIRDIALSDDVAAIVRFLPQVSGFWAMPGVTLGGPGGLSGGGTSGGIVDALLGIHEASLVLQLGAWVRFEIGRFEMSYGDVVVVGNLDWHPNARAFDGARVRITPAANSYWIDAFFTLVNEGHAISLTGAPTGGGFGQADQYFYGLYAGLGSLLDTRATTALDFYALVLQTNNRFASVLPFVELEWSLRATVGSRFRYTFDAVDVRAEGALQVGREGGSRMLPTDPFSRQQEVVAGFFLGELGLTVLENRLRFAVEGNFASGNDPTTTNVSEGYAHLFPTAHAFLGYTDVMGARSNVGSAVLHVTGRPVPELAVHLDVHSFVVPERANAASSYAGSEGNLNVVWSPLTGLRLRAMYGVFFPETAYWRLPGAPNYTTDPVHYLEVELGFVLR